MKLYAISDLHVGYPDNRAFVEAIPPHPDDWLVLAGDVGESPDQLAWVLRTLGGRFHSLAWVPGNHELWTVPNGPSRLSGEHRYQYLVDLCRSMGVLTPEDDYPVLEFEQDRVVLVLLFLLYDYSFRPPGMTREQALLQAMNAGVVCTDEFLLHPDPYPDRAAWCQARVEATAARLNQLSDPHPRVLVSHFPLRRDLVHLPRIPQFELWCGTRQTTDWHLRFRASVVVSGHLHVPSVQWRDGVRFEEVSLGYPHQWRRYGGPREVKQILPHH